MMHLLVCFAWLFLYFYELSVCCVINNLWLFAMLQVSCLFFHNSFHSLELCAFLEPSHSAVKTTTAATSVCFGQVSGLILSFGLVALYVLVEYLCAGRFYLE